MHKGRLLGFLSHIYHDDEYYAIDTKGAFYKTNNANFENELKEMNVKDLSIKSISDAIINIRTKKLPNPKEIGNAGSFFKNPVVSNEKFESLIEQFPEIAHYKLPNNTVKIAAGWLIDSLGWKGKKFDNFGVHKNQALVLVNYGGGTGKDIYDLSSSILKSVKETYEITLEREVNIY